MNKFMLLAKKWIPLFKKYLTPIFNTRAAGLYILLFAGSIAIATFIENDFGTSSAQKVIFKSWWFELLLLLFSITIVVNIFKFRMIQQKKWSLLIFHGAIIIILIGAGITRYFGFEGVMHIRENDSSNSFLSFNTFLKFEVKKNGETFNFDEEVLFASLGNNNWHESYLIEGDLIDVQVKEFIPNPKQVLTTSMEGKPTLMIVVAGTNGREEYFISKGQTKRIRNVIYNFKNTQLPQAININFVNDSLVFKTDKTLTQMVMATQQKDTLNPTEKYRPLKLRSLYSDGINNFVLSDFNKSGITKIESENSKVKNESTSALLMDITVNGKTQQAYVYGSRGLSGRPQTLNFGDSNLSVAYGAKDIKVPFSIKLKKFILDKYPGTNSASSYASEVQLIDGRKNVNKNYRIFMNNILDHRGYRFFQSSFDKDEKGTYLSVNNDFWGTLISYIGYALLTIGLLMTFFSKNTRFYQVLEKIKKIRAKSGTFIWLLFFLFSSTSFFAQSQDTNSYLEYVISTSHADTFSKLVVQDHKGRMKPIHTLSREIMRKLYRKESFEGLNADQVMLSMFVNKKEWSLIKIIKLGKHEDIIQQLGATSNYASFKDFFNEKGEYKLRDEVRRVYDLNPKDRGVYEKELLKIDERLNILNMVFTGDLLKIIPLVDDLNDTWISKHRHGNDEHDDHGNHVAANFFNAYETTLNKALATDDYSEADKLLEELKAYQIKHGGEVMPSASKVKAEIMLNKMNVFNRLAIFYFLLGLTFLGFLFLSVFVSF